MKPEDCGGTWAARSARRMPRTARRVLHAPRRVLRSARRGVAHCTPHTARHPSDFFYAAFSPNTSSDGVVNSSTPIWLGIGRVLATTPAEGFAYNRKVMHYQESNQCLGEWRNTVTLFSDDMEAAWESSFVTDNEWIYNWLKYTFFLED